MKLLIAFINFIKISSNIKKNYNIVFYSENKNYFVLFDDIIVNLLKENNISIIYISSELNDQGLKIINKNFFSYYLGRGNFFAWIVKNLNADLLITSTPDLGTSKFEKSSKIKHYIYIQHSLISLHKGYLKNSFKYFDTVFCCGQHHKKELLKIIKYHKYENINTLEHGYPIIEKLIDTKQSYQKKHNENIILIAPTWGNREVFQNEYMQIIEKLLNKKYKVIFRPHPEMIRKDFDILKLYQVNFSNNKNFCIEYDISSKKSFFKCDYLISDWSGAALEYILLFKKSVIFLDINEKIRNKLYNEINITSFEDYIRKSYGIIVKKNNIKDILNFIYNKNYNFKLNDYLYFDHNIKSYHRALKYIKKLIK